MNPILPKFLYDSIVVSAPVQLTSAQLTEAAEVAAIGEAKAAELKAFNERIDYERDLAEATALLVVSIRRLRTAGECSAYPTFARFRKELSPLAETYGVKIVLVGDKSKATLVG